MPQINMSQDVMLQLQRLAAREMMDIALDHVARSRRIAQTTRTPGHSRIVESARNRCSNVHRQKRVPRGPNGAWPPVMRVTMAAAYMEEISVDTFRSRVRAGVYSGPVQFPGRGEVWLRDDLDADIDRLSNRVDKIRDAADVL